MHIVLPPLKRKSITLPDEIFSAERKRAKCKEPKPDHQSGLPIMPPPLQLARDDELAYAFSTKVIGILKDAMIAADAEVRRQMAQGAGLPSSVGLQELLSLLLQVISDGKGKDKSNE